MAGLLGIEELERAEIEAILARAKDFQPIQNQSFKRLDTLKGKMIVNLFFEASTRTRTSFEILGLLQRLRRKAGQQATGPHGGHGQGVQVGRIHAARGGCAGAIDASCRVTAAGGQQAHSRPTPAAGSRNVNALQSPELFHAAGRRSLSPSA